jgi:hypothetical protein
MSGSGWLIAAKGEKAVSELGKDVADLLGELFFGIYHIQPEVMRADFSNPTWIEVLVHKSLATFDFNELTRLVFLAHHMAIRVDVSAARNGILRLMFHRRERDGGISKRHPTLDEAVCSFKNHVSVPEAK